MSEIGENSESFSNEASPKVEKPSEEFFPQPTSHEDKVRQKEGETDELIALWSKLDQEKGMEDIQQIGRESSRKLASDSSSAPRYKDLPVHKVPNFTAPFHFMNRIFLRTKQYRDYLSEDPKPETIAVLEHEYTHFKRLGSSLRNLIKYWTKREFRFQEELVAIRQEMKTLKQNRRVFDTGKRAKMLSGFGYFWCTNYETAKQRLDKMWEEV